jgi:spore germination cell wall hydrolase CwlJ-like protein
MKGTLEFVIESARAVLASLAISHEVDTGFINAEEELKCMAENIYFEGRAEPITDGADHYYNYNIANPYWVGAMTETVIIGNHRFMKEKR